MPTFKNELAPDLSEPPAQQQPQLEKDREELEEKIERFEERCEALAKLLAKSSESRLTNKVNELQEELCQKRFELHVAHIHLAAVKSQLQLFEYNYRPTNFGASTLSLLAGKLEAAASSQMEQLSSQVSSSTLQQSLARKSSNNSGQSHHQPLGYRNKWIKAFKSLKETPSSSSVAPPGGSQR